MRICIDATSLLLRSAGIKNYTWYWLNALRAELPGDAVSAFPLLGKTGELNHERSPYSLSGTLPRLALLKLANLGFPHLPDLMVGNADIFHATSQVHRPPTHPKLTATIFDMTVMLMPELHTAGNRQAESDYYDRVLRPADGLIAISEASKLDAVRLLGLDERRITVIYPGVDSRFFYASPTHREKPYALYVGTIEPRKNVDNLLDAWLALPDELRTVYDLVIAGPMGWATKRTRDRLQAGDPGVHYLGYVSESELPGLTAGASIFAYPSLYEGFGFPLAQAMAAGRPCITSNVSSLPEVAAGSALLIDPRSVSELRDALTRLLTSADLRDGLGQKARQRAAAFTWTSAGRQSADFFRRVCQSSY